MDLKENAVTLLSSTTVSLAADADTTLYTVPASKRCILSYALLVLGADAGTSEISIGADGTETDFLPTQHLDNLDAEFDVGFLCPLPSGTASAQKSYAAGTVIEAQVTNNAGGGTNTLFLYGMLY